MRSPMPYRYELQNRQHFSRAVLTGVALAFLLLFLAMAPAKILAWSGFGFGSLTVPVPVSAPAIEGFGGDPDRHQVPPPAGNRAVRLPGVRGMERHESGT